MVNTRTKRAIDSENRNVNQAPFLQRQHEDIVSHATQPVPDGQSNLPHQIQRK